MNAFMSLSRRWLGKSTSNQLKYLPDGQESVENPPFNFLALPVDLRFEIYKCIANNSPSGYPADNPLYHLLFVSKQIRDEVCSVFYTGSSLVFPSPSTCLSFLELTAPYIHLLTSLSISVPNGDTYSLEPVFRKLHEAGAPLKTLILDLQCINWKVSTPDSRHVQPRMAGELALDRARQRAQSLETIYERSTRCPKRLPRNPNPAENLTFYKCPSYLGEMESIRYIAIDGNPFDNWNVEFELAVLNLHERMYQIAKGEVQVHGKGPACYGRWGDWYWFGSHELVKRGDLAEKFSILDFALR